MATVIVEIRTIPLNLFEAVLPGPSGFGTARTPGFSYHVQNVEQQTIRYASAAAMPADLSMGFRLVSGNERDLQIRNEPTWAWVAAGAGRLAIEI